MKRKKRKILLIAAMSAFFAYLYNKIIITLATKDNQLFSTNSMKYNWKHGTIFYTKRGKGAPILLIHDLDAISSEYEWNKVIRPLEENHTVYTIDLIGCGRSDKPMITYTNYLYVQLITDFIKDIIDNETDIIATGFSTTFVTMACYQNPALFKNLFFINPPSITSNPPNKYYNVIKRLWELPIIGSLFFNLISSKRNIRKVFENKYFYNKKLVSNKLINIYHESAHTNDTYSRFLYASMITTFTNVNISTAMYSIKNPIYLILGDHLEMLEERMDEYFDINSNIDTITISNTKYLPQLENPKEVVSTVEQILTFEK